MLKGSGDRIIPNMEGPGHAQVPWMEGYHHEPKQDSIKFKDHVCTPWGMFVPWGPCSKGHPCWAINCLQENYQGTLGYMWFTPRWRLHSDFNYTCTTCESKGGIHLVRRGAGLVIAVVTLVGSLVSLAWERIYTNLSIKKKKKFKKKIRDWPR